MRSIIQHLYQKFIEFKSIFSLDNAVKPFSQSGIVVSVYSIIRSSFIRWYSTSTVKLLYIRYLQVVPIFLWESGISRYTKEISCLAHAHFGQRNICWFSSKNSSIYKCIFFFFRLWLMLKFSQDIKQWSILKKVRHRHAAYWEIFTDGQWSFNNGLLIKRLKLWKQSLQTLAAHFTLSTTSTKRIRGPLGMPFNN